ncbi:hypothetical protein SAMN05216516_1196 [Izhakiella capsodis]|uniref:Uncharacterized protein n=1 Tax=Izhakiella capsodis TaxID=1367852 RepID=A0A1I5BME7_9GAMM|nr:hypothetical protein [Izhakiella capsodis]SFN75837.1 hypothetical protein SAMN05216516_1196 [Izhakiella capsodis]
MFDYKFIIEFSLNSKTIVERRDFKPCVGTVAGQDVGNTGQSELIKRPAGRFSKTTERIQPNATA